MSGGGAAAPRINEHLSVLGQLSLVSGPRTMSGKLLLVIPPVVRFVDGAHEVEADFAHNLRAYLRSFSHVTLACPVLALEKDGGIIRSLPLRKVQDSDRLSYIPLPYAYREDRYVRHYFKIRRLLRSEISKADYLLFAPHAKYDWSTLATRQAVNMGRKYDVESDWDQGNVSRLYLAAMPPGFAKLRKALWTYSHLHALKECFSRSALALLQGQDVYDAYKDIAPNPHKILNVQVSSEDHISDANLSEKLARIRAGRSLTVSYAGRMIDMKGPLDWIKAIYRVVSAGVALRAIWFGDGSLMPHMEKEARQLGIDSRITFAGIVGRDAIMTGLRQTDIFLFCHKTAESPRCLGEALAAGCPLVGYDSAYARDLVAMRGGGEFAKIGDHQGLADVVIALDRDRSKLASLAVAAAASGRLLDREAAIQRRIDLIKKYL